MALRFAIRHGYEGGCDMQLLVAACRSAESDIFWNSNGLDSTRTQPLARK